MSDTPAGGTTRVPELLQSAVTIGRIALNNGVATLYASIFILAIGLCCVRGLWERIGLNGTRSEVLHQLMQTPQEPLRPDTSPMLSSAVLGKEIAAWELCRDGAGKLVDNVISQAAAAFWQAYDASLQKAAPPIELVPIQQAEPVAGLNPALTDKDHTLSPLTLPSALYEYWPRAGAPDPARLAARVKASLDGLEAIRLKLALAEPTAQSAGAIRFFFISVDGFMRYTPSLDESTPTPLPPHRTFNHPSYVLEALGRHGAREGSHPCGTAYETVPYFDILGGGVVMTTCRRMPDQVSATSMAQGVLCTDVALPQRLLIESIEHNPLIGADFFVYDRTAARLEKCARDHGEVSCDTRVPVAHDSKVQDRVRKWLQSLETPRPSGYAGASPLTTLAGDRSYDHAAVLWHEAARDPDGKPRTLLGLALFNIPLYTFDLISWAWLGGAVLCLGLLVYLLAKQRVALANAQVFALQRGLSVGVVWVDRKDGIIGVNDRAEFLIGEKLPRLGLTPRPGVSKRGEIRFKALIDLGCIVVREDHRLSVHPYNHVDKLRKEGVCSVYWIRLSQEKRWLKVTGAPVFEPDVGAGNQPTVGLLEPAERSMEKDLEKVLQTEADDRAERDRER